ncbi:MAG TPA: NUDIX domain-containing protein, partial [Herpetosiphonaceae bacterium]
MDLPAFVFPLLRVVRIPAAVKWHLARILNTHFLLGVAGVVRDDEGRLLLFKHTYRKRYPWGLPGGWMSRGESPLEGLKREIYEESKLEIVPERLLLIGTSRDRPKMEFIVSARVV